ncbi:MAG TPA: zinc ribbon domain-containing protein [Stellaceae bacterium]|nr:zinc ribbon domain-containing protein [Stellaceae bacterium]
MPVYDYSCETCGAFVISRPMAEYREPHDCPACGAPAPRALLTPPRLANMESARRSAFQTNERAAHSPRQAERHVHGPRCGCAAPRTSSGAAKSFLGARPWMISH